MLMPSCLTTNTRNVYLQLQLRKHEGTLLRSGLLSEDEFYHVTRFSFKKALLLSSVSLKQNSDILLWY